MKIYEITEPRAETIVLEDLTWVQNKVNGMMGKYGLPKIKIINHAKDRTIKGRSANDPTRTVTDNEAGALLSKGVAKYGDQLSKMPHNTEAILRSDASNINMPFAVKHRPDGTTELLILTIQRKADFKTNDPVLRV